MKRLLAAAAFATLAASVASAGGLDTLEANSKVQAERIEQGRISGELTKREYRALKAEKAKVDADVQNALADGRLSRREYRKLHDEQIGVYRDIKSETNDGQKSWIRRWFYLHRG